MKRKYIILIALNKANATLGQSMLSRVRQVIDAAAATHWIDSKGVGIFVFTDWPANAIHRELLSLCRHTADDGFLAHLAVMELAGDHSAAADSKTLAWLHSHP
jgi:hypothetical protein